MAIVDGMTVTGEEDSDEAEIESLKIDSERSIYLTENITRESFNNLFPQVQRLKAISSEPIYLHIDSLGGSVNYSSRLFDLLTSPRCNGGLCPFVAVVPQLAASAAADLAILSDYAIVAQMATIHCHGTRAGYDTVTEDNLELIHTNLQGTNRSHTLRLSQKVAIRLCHRVMFANGGDNFCTGVLLPSPGADGRVFEDALGYMNWLVSVPGILSEAGQKVAQKSVDEVDEWFKTWKNNSPNDERKVIAKAICDDFIKSFDFDGEFSLEELGWKFYKRVCQVAAYSLYWESSGSNRADIAYFICSTDARDKFRQQMDDHPEDMEEHEKELYEPLLGSVLITRLLATTLCQSLNSGENSLTGIDAYLLGLVDEVQGILGYSSINRP